MAKKAALGRGLGALIESVEDTTPSYPNSSNQMGDNGVNINFNQDIEMSEIEANPYQPRTTFDKELLQELAESIKVHGVIQPITVRRKEDGGYQIISGERRFRASKLAGETTIPAYIRSADDQEMIEMALIENIQRDDLDAIEIAITYQRLMDECKLTQEDLGGRVGKNRTTVSNYLRLLKLPADIQQNIRERKISMGHARAIISVDNARVQSKIAKQIVESGISVRQTEELVKKHNEPQEKKKGNNADVGEELPDNYCTLVELLETYFNNNINIKRNNKGEGSITISFTSDNEVNEFIEKLSK